MCIRDSIPREHRSAGLATLSTLEAFARTVSAFVFGLIWDRVSVDSALTVMLGGLVLTVGIVGIFAVLRETPTETE